MESAAQYPFVHEALVYSSDQELLARLVPFIGEGIHAGDPVLVVLPAQKIALVQDALGPVAGDVQFTDATVFYGRPATVVAAYRRVVDEHAGRRLRVVGEVQFGPSVAGHAAWTRYESIVNECFGDSGVWIICPYDSRELPAHVVAYAPCTHQYVSAGEKHDASTTYRPTAELVARPSVRDAHRPLGEPLEHVTVRDEAGIEPATNALASAAAAAGLDPDTVADLEVVVEELVRRALPRGAAEVVIGRDDRQWICDVVVPAPASHVGVSIARLVGRGLELSTDRDRETVRLRFAGASV